MSHKPHINPKLFNEDASNILLQNLIAQSGESEGGQGERLTGSGQGEQQVSDAPDLSLGKVTPEQIKAQEQKAKEDYVKQNIGFGFAGPVYGMTVDGVCVEIKPGQPGHPDTPSPAPAPAQKKKLLRVSQSEEEFNDDIERYWHEFDRNKNGQLEYKEFYDAVYKVFDEEHRELPGFKEVLGIMKQMDTDGNNKIDKNEFRQFLIKFKGSLNKD